MSADLTIDAEVDPDVADRRYLLSARFNVNLPRVEREVAQALLIEARQICPYSRTTGGNVDVAIELMPTSS